MSSPHSDSTDVKDQKKTRDELVCELVALRDSVKELQAGESRRTQAEEALRQSREMVDKILSASPFAISYFEARKLRWTNQAGVEMFGYQSERECLGMSPEEFYSSESEFLRVREKFLETIEKGRPAEIEARLKRKDGSIFDAYMRINCVDPSDPTRGIISATVDISDRKKMEQGLQAAEQLLRTILSAAPLGISFVEDGKLRWTNQAMAQIFGNEMQDDYLGTDISDFYSTKEEYKRVQKELYRSLKQGSTPETEAQFRRKDGTIFLGHVRISVLDPANPRKGTVSAVADITERKQAEEVLRVQTERFQTLCESAPFGMVMISKDGDFTYVNPKFTEIFGYGLDELPNGREWFRKAYPDPAYRHEVISVWMTDFAGLPPGGTISRVFTVTCKDGSRKRINFRPVKLRGEDLMTCEDITERKQAEEVLRVQTERFQTLCESAPFGMVMISKDGDFTYVNPKFTEMFGYGLDEVPNGREWYRKAYPDPAYRHEAISVWITDFAGLPTGETNPRIFTVTCKDGSQKIIHFRPVKLRGEDLLTCEDITERKRAEADLLESEERYRTILESVDYGYYEVDAKGKFIFVNEEMAKLFGERTAAQMIGRNYRLYMIQEEGTSLFKVFNEVWNTGEPVKSVELQFTKSDGADRDLEFSVALIRNAQGNRIGFRGIVRDVTERRKAVEAVRRSEETARALLNATTDAALLTDSEGNVLALNEGAALRLSHSTNRAPCRNVFELLPSGQAFARKAECDEVIRTGKPARFVDRDSGNFLDNSVYPVFDKNGAVERLAIFSRDITDQVQAEDALRRAKEAAEAADRAKSDFLANMSHELRTPLNAIIALSEVLEDQTFGKLNGTQLEYVGIVLNSGRHLLQLINDILDLAKVESGKMELHLSEVGIRTVLEGSLVMIKEKALKHGLKLELRVEAEINDATIHADEVKLKQILFNLLSNAAKFTPDGGEILLEAGQDGDDLLIRVSDTGIGINQKDQERIFGEFEQIDSSYAKQHQGTGLGLALTRRLVELHGGRIWVESGGEGTGSTFAFMIPFRASREGKIAAPENSTVHELIRPEPGPALQPFLDESRPTILVVDDDHAANNVIAHYLIEAGYSVAQAFDADQAIQMARRMLPSAITLDVVMHQRSGFDALIELKSWPETKEIPVVMVTVTDERELGLSLGAVEFFVKPLDRKRFLDVIHAMASKKTNERPTVLVIDDDPHVVETIAEMLHFRGYNLLKAYSGRQGIDLALAHLPDAIVLDLLMPQVTGFEVLERLRENPSLRDTPIIVYTAKDLTHEDRQRLRMPVTATTSKSDGRNQLLRQLERLLRHDHADQESKGG